MNRLEADTIALSIDKLIKGRFFEYFPDLKINKSDIILLKCKHPQLRLNSQIYKYNLVTTKNKIVKTIYIKVCKSAEHEYKNLKYLQEKLIPFNEFDVAKPLDFLPGLNAVVTEECPGENLRHVLKQYSLPILNKYKKDYIRESIYRAGEWLGTFHRLTCDERGEKIDLDSILYSSKENLKKWSQVLNSKTINSIYKELKVRGYNISNRDLTIAKWHQDFRPTNIFISSKRVSIIDYGTDPRNYLNFIYYDLTHFIIDLYILSMYPLYNFKFLHSLCENFLQGYISRGFEISVSTLKFFEIVTLSNYLTAFEYFIAFLLDNGYSQSFLTPFKIHIYTYLLKQFVYQKFELMLNQEFGYNGYTI